MFWPQCRAEYRPGFTRCPDCEADLVHQLSESDAGVSKTQSSFLSSLRRDWSRSSLKIMYEEARKTVFWWARYKRQTGRWPWPSIVIHFMNWVVILFGGAFLVWWTGEHHLSRWQFGGILLSIGLPYIAVENWAKRRMKLNLLRNRDV